MSTLALKTPTLNDEQLDRIQPKVLSFNDFRHEQETWRGIRIESYQPVLGATVRGLRIDENTPADPGLGQFLHDRLVRYGFLQFEPGAVTVENFSRLVALFGKARYLGTPYTPQAQETPDVNTIDSSIKKTRMNYIWHIDQGFREDAPRFTSLFGKNVPDYGGDTIFSNATAAYDLLDPLLAQYLETLTAVHDVETQGFLTLAYRDPQQLAEERAKLPPIEAPLIRTHPETGKKQIFANELYTQRILGVSRATSQSLLNILFEAITAPEVQVRYRWIEGSALIWDNRVVQHRGVGDFGKGLRVLHRALVY
jgi:taurine dioxygenase